jgi:S-adenosylhomocysteine hydrolase
MTDTQLAIHSQPIEGTGLTRAQYPANQWRTDDQTSEDVLCPRLPVLDFLHDEIGGLDESIRGLFGLQHLLGSTASLIDSLTKDQIEASDVFLLGKPYSTNKQVMRRLSVDRGYWVYPFSTMQPIDQANDDVMDRRIEAALSVCQKWMQQIPEDETSRVLLIDDGGRAIRLLHTPQYEDIAHRFTCVEQTRCGIRTIEDLELRVPVINVAESWVKLEHESPLIAESVKNELSKKLTAMEAAGIDTGDTALIIGYGAIGRTVSSELKRQGRQVAVYDHEESRLELANSDDYQIYRNLHKALGRGGLIVGCTGKPVLDCKDYNFIPNGSILVSTSSSDVEFRGWQLRVNAHSLGRPESWFTDTTIIDNDHPCFSLYRTKFGDRQFYLVNGGFPVNFNGDIDPIAPEYIQLTRGLLYLGAFQASNTQSPGLHELDDQLQHILWWKYQQLTQLQYGGARC